MSEITKGPWRVNPIDSTLGTVYRVYGNGRGYQDPVVCGHVIRRADAEAIASLPDLLEALREAREHIDAYSPDDGARVIARIDAVLKKATGP